MDTYVNLTEKEFESILNCIQVVQDRMGDVGGNRGLGWHTQEYRAFVRMTEKMNSRKLTAWTLKMKKLK